MKFEIKCLNIHSVPVPDFTYYPYVILIQNRDQQNITCDTAVPHSCIQSAKQAFTSSLFFRNIWSKQVVNA